MTNARAFIVMMSKNKAKMLLRALVLVFWALLLWKVASFLMSNGMHWRSLPHQLRLFIGHAGLWGALALIAAHMLRTLLFIPSSVLEIAAGSLFGPVLGTILNVIGANVSAAIAFSIGRIMGREYFSHHERGWLKLYDEAMTKDGFSAVLVMRLIFVPFDIVSYGSGMTGMRFSDYAVSTFLGTLPAIIAFTVAGNSLGKPRGLLVFLFLSVVIVALVLLLKRHPWTRSKLFRNHT